MQKARGSLGIDELSRMEFERNRTLRTSKRLIQIIEGLNVNRSTLGKAMSVLTSDHDIKTFYVQYADRIYSSAKGPYSQRTDLPEMLKGEIREELKLFNEFVAEKWEKYTL